MNILKLIISILAATLTSSVYAGEFSNFKGFSGIIELIKIFTLSGVIILMFALIFDLYQRKIKHATNLGNQYWVSGVKIISATILIWINLVLTHNQI